MASHMPYTQTDCLAAQEMLTSLSSLVSSALSALRGDVPGRVARMQSQAPKVCAVAAGRILGHVPDHVRVCGAVESMRPKPYGVGPFANP